MGFRTVCDPVTHSARQVGSKRCDTVGELGFVRVRSSNGGWSKSARGSSVIGSVERKHGVSLIARTVTVIKINLPHCVIVFHQLSGRPPVPFVLLLADALFLCLFLGTASGGGSAGGSTGLTSARSATPLFFGLVAFFCFPMMLRLSPWAPVWAPVGPREGDSGR